MRNYLIYFILFIVSSPAFSCGYYPYGEDIRFNILKPATFDIKGFDAFHYTFFNFYSANTEAPLVDKFENDENVDLWYHYFNKSINKSSIYEAIYSISSKDLKSGNTKNEFSIELNKPINKGIKDYLIFAKKCSPLNCYFSDPWEKNSKFDKITRNKAIQKALKQAELTTQAELKQRYAYLAIRLAYYNNDKKKLNKIYLSYFNKNENLNAIDYWALHFKLQFEPSSEKRNIDIANVFAHSSEKRYATHFFFDKELDFNKTLSLAATNDEKASLHLLYATRKIDYALSNIQEFEKFSSDEKQLSFLVVRELNKMEDWILTPYYSLFEPSFSTSWYGDKMNLDSINIRIKKDQLYALEFAKWMDKIDSKSEHWNTLKNYAYFLSGESNNLLPRILNEQQTHKNNKKIYNFNQQLSALIQLRNSKKPNLSDEQIQNTIIENAANSNQFLFAIARELEYKGNTLDAAFIFSHINEVEDWSGKNQMSFWKSTKSISTWYDDFYMDYFFYLDAQYSENEIHEIIDYTIKSKEISEFEKWKINIIKNKIARLYDLLGTKFLRKDDLNNALKNYNLVNDTLWESEHYPYQYYLNANPFYTNLYNEHSATKADTIKYTKPQVIKKLIDLKSKLKTAKESDLAYLNYHIANCYLNMTQYGNSWIMKRYYWTSTESHTGLEDDLEYFQCLLAKKYYLDAYHTSKKSKIKALSLRMAGRCEKYRLLDLYREEYISEEKAKEIFYENVLFKKLKNEFPEHYEPLVSNCESFIDYYNSFN